MIAKGIGLNMSAKITLDLSTASATATNAYPLQQAFRRNR